MKTTAGQALRFAASARPPMRQARCAGTALNHGAAARGSPPAGPVTWPLPEVEVAAPRFTRSRLCFVMSRLPMSVITCPGPGSGKTVLLRSWIGQAGAAGLLTDLAPLDDRLWPVVDDA